VCCADVDVDVDVDVAPTTASVVFLLFSKAKLIILFPTPKVFLNRNNNNIRANNN